MNIYNSFKIIFINLLVFILFVLLIEIIFGYWFKKNNFSHHMTGKRLQKVDFKININNKIHEWQYNRDYYGFREDFDHGNKYDLSKVKIIFTGGSTGAENLKPYEKTIVGNLNQKLKMDKLDFKIFNGSLAGKSLQGSILDFYVWFDKLKNLKPKIIIFYIGINDRELIPPEPWSDHKSNSNNFILRAYNEINQKSFFFDKLRVIKNKYFPLQNTDGFKIFDENIKEIFKKSKFINYENAKSKFFLKNNDETKIIKAYKDKLNTLKYELEKRKIKPIFITQINYEGNSDKILYFLNEELKLFSKKNKFSVIALDEMVNTDLNGLFIDTIHTNEKGSLYISNLLYPKIKELIVDNY